MDDLIQKINKAYENINLLKALNLPVSQEQKDIIANLEKEYIQSTIIPDVIEIVQGNVFKNLRPFSLQVNYDPEAEEGINVLLASDESQDETLELTSSSPKKKHDKTKFSFDGIYYHTKKKFVYECVKKYIEDHPTVTLDELELVFPSEIYGKTNGVVRRWSDIQERMIQHPDLKKRFFLDPKERIILNDKTEIVINNQWGDKFGNFLKVAKKLYDVKSDAPYEGL